MQARDCSAEEWHACENACEHSWKAGERAGGDTCLCSGKCYRMQTAADGSSTWKPWTVRYTDLARRLM